MTMSWTKSSMKIAVDKTITMLVTLDKSQAGRKARKPCWTPTKGKTSRS